MSYWWLLSLIVIIPIVWIFVAGWLDNRATKEKEEAQLRRKVGYPKYEQGDGIDGLYRWAENEHVEYAGMGEPDIITKVKELENINALTGKWYIENRDGKEDVLFLEICGRSKTTTTYEVRDTLKHDWRRVDEIELHEGNYKWLSEFDFVEVNVCGN